MRLEGKVAIVTGASRGIGKGIAQRLAQEGARVAMTARGADALHAAAHGIEASGGTVLAIPGDAGDTADVEATFTQVLEKWGTVDVLVNNAAWASPLAHFLEMDEAHWDTVIRTNLKSVYLHCHRAANIMVDRGTRGSIVNISSFAAARAHRNMAAYDASKGGMEAMTRSMAIDLGPFGIRISQTSAGADGAAGSSRLPRRHRRCGRLFGLRGRQLHHRPDHLCGWRHPGSAALPAGGCAAARISPAPPAHLRRPSLLRSGEILPAQGVRQAEAPA